MLQPGRLGSRLPSSVSCALPLGQSSYCTCIFCLVRLPLFAREQRLFLSLPTALSSVGPCSSQARACEAKENWRNPLLVVAWILRSRLVFLLLSTFLSLLVFALHAVTEVFSCTEQEE